MKGIQLTQSKSPGISTCYPKAPKIPPVSNISSGIMLITLKLPSWFAEIVCKKISVFIGIELLSNSASAWFIVATTGGYLAQSGFTFNTILYYTFTINLLIKLSKIPQTLLASLRFPSTSFQISLALINASNFSFFFQQQHNNSYPTLWVRYLICIQI